MSTQETTNETANLKKAKASKKAAKATKPAKAKKGAKVGPLKPKQFKRAREGPFAVMIRATVLSVGSGRTAMRQVPAIGHLK